MKLKELVRCSLPVLAEGTDPAYPYWFGGTCFLVRSRGKLVVLTARHVLANKTKDELRIQRNLDAIHFLKLSWLYTDQTPDSYDNDYADWALFTVAEEADEGMERIVPALDLDVLSSVGMPPSSKNSQLILSGYPSAHSKIDYEKKRLRWTSILATASYVGRSPSSACEQLRFDDLSKVEGLDGMSGSPVFLLGPDGGNPRTVAFAGMLIRATKVSGLGTFIRGDLLKLIVDGAIGKAIADGDL